MASRTIRLFTCPLLALAVLLGACAHKPTQSMGMAGAEQHSVTVSKVPATSPAQSDSAAAAVAPAVADATAPPADHGTDNAAESPTVEPAGWPAEQPPAAPVVTDLFERIRGGFALDDVDQKAIDRELNW